MKLRLTIFILAYFTTLTNLWSQDKTEFETSRVRLQKTFDSDSSVFHYSLRDMDSLLIRKIKILNDTLLYAPYTTTEKPYYRDKTFKQPDQGKVTTETFIANNNENWRSGDHIDNINRQWPARIFLFGVTNANWSAIFYWHGGAATHIHIVLTDGNSLTSFRAFDNDVVRKLHYAKALRKIESYQLNNIATIKDVYYLNNKLMDDGGDIF